MISIAIAAASVAMPGAAFGQPELEQETTVHMQPTRPEPPPFGFSGMEMYRLSLDAYAIAFGDINGDGLTDIVVPENAYARIQCFVQRADPPAAPADRGALNPNVLPDDTRFEKRRYLAGKRIYNVALGDLNGNGRDDLAFYGDPPELVIHYQGEDGNWSERRTFDIRDGAKQPLTLIIADFNADERNDICLLGEDSTYFIYQETDGTLGRPVKFPGVPAGVFALMAGDFDGDGRTDLLYATGDEDEPFAIRLQSAEGRMRPEATFKLPRIRALIAGDLEMDGASEILAIEAATGRLVVYKLDRKEPPPGLLNAQPRRYSLPATGPGNPRAMELADLDGDGRLDVLMTAPATAEIEWFRQDTSGALLRPLSFPSLQNATALRVVDFDGEGRKEVVVLSPDERTLGLARFTDEGRIGFPIPIDTLGKPLAVAVGDLNNDGKMEMVCASADGDTRNLIVLHRSAEGEFTPRPPLEIEGARSNPTDILVADVDQDGLPDLLVFLPFEGMRIFRQESEGEFVPVAPDRGYGVGFSRQVEARNVSLGDVTGNGKAELLVTHRNFARALRLEASGVLRVVDQFNAGGAESLVECVAASDLDGDGVNEVLLLDTHRRRVVALKRQPEGAYRVADSVDIGRIRPSRMIVEDFDRDGKKDILIFGENRIVIMQSGADRLELAEIADYETETLQGRLADVSIGDLNGDGKPDVVLNEQSQNSLEFLTYDRHSRTFKARLKFQVFERRAFGGGNGQRSVEPRVMEIADVTGDGKNDLILIIHDRMMVYPQD